MASFLNNIFGKKEENLLEDKIFQEESFDVKDIIAPPYIGVLQDHIKLGERLAKSFFAFSYPRYLNTGWFSPVINLDTPVDISFFIHPVSSELILKKDLVHNLTMRLFPLSRFHRLYNPEHKP